MVWQIVILRMDMAKTEGMIEMLAQEVVVTDMEVAGAPRAMKEEETIGKGPVRMIAPGGEGDLLTEEVSVFLCLYPNQIFKVWYWNMNLI